MAYQDLKTARKFVVDSPGERAVGIPPETVLITFQYDIAIEVVRDALEQPFKELLDNEDTTLYAVCEEVHT